MHQANLFPAFEGPEHQNLHTKGKECVCVPFFRVFMGLNAADEGVEILKIHHRPLTQKNKDNPPTWLPSEDDPDWKTLSLSNGETLSIE